MPELSIVQNPQQTPLMLLAQACQAHDSMAGSFYASVVNTALLTKQKNITSRQHCKRAGLLQVCQRAIYMVVAEDREAPKAQSIASSYNVL